MYRSASWNRGTEDYSSAPPKGLWMGSMIRPLDGEEPPSYNNPPEEMVKKEMSHATFAENAIPIILFVLLSYALVLWLFSNPARVEGLTIKGDIDNNSDGTQTGLLGAALELGVDSDKPHLVDRNRRASRKLIKGLY